MVKHIERSILLPCSDMPFGANSLHSKKRTFRPHLSSQPECDEDPRHSREPPREVRHGSRARRRLEFKFATEGTLGASAPGYLLSRIDAQQFFLTDETT
jgi:hypothetical protein